MIPKADLLAEEIQVLVGRVATIDGSGTPKTSENGIIPNTFYITFVVPSN
jgi:hypothetical protein